MSRVEMDKTTYGQAQVWVMKCSHIKEKVCPTFWYLQRGGLYELHPIWVSVCFPVGGPCSYMQDSVTLTRGILPNSL